MPRSLALAVALLALGGCADRPTGTAYTPEPNDAGGAADPAVDTIAARPFVDATVPAPGATPLGQGDPEPGAYAVPADSAAPR